MISQPANGFLKFLEGIDAIFGTACLDRKGAMVNVLWGRAPSVSIKRLHGDMNAKSSHCLGCWPVAGSR